MTCAPTDRLLQTLAIEAPGATPELLSLQLFNVMDEFFRRTSAWQWRQDIDLAGDELNYGFAVPNGSQVVRMISVEHNGVSVPAAQGTGLTQSSLGELVPELTFPDGDAQFHPAVSDLQDNIFSYAIYRPNYITVTTLPDPEQQKFPLRVCLALTVSKTCLECDSCDDWGVEEWVWDMFFQDLLDGTLGRLMAMINKPWSSPLMASYHGKRFRNAMAYRKQEALRGFTYGLPAWRFPRTSGWTR